MSFYNWLLFAHVLGAIGWLGGGLMLTVMALGARSRSTREAVSEFARTLPYVGPRVLLPSSMVVPVTGVWMVLINAGWRFSELWILLAIGLFALAFVIGAVQVGRIGIQLTRLGLESNLAHAQRELLVNRWLGWYSVVLVILAGAVADMVFKPGL